MVINVGWMVDSGVPRAGMVLSVEAFEDAMPRGFVLTHCTPDKRPYAYQDIDIYVTHADLFDRRWIELMKHKPVMAHRHGGWHMGDPVMRRWILDNANLITWNSPKQRELFRYPVHSPESFVPLPIDVARFQEAAARYDGEREGMIFYGLICPAKGISYAMDWALRHNASIDFYGEHFLRRDDPIVPPCSYCGPVDYEDIPDLLAHYKDFIFLPQEPDLYSRTVVEAHASGLGLILGGDVKALMDWIDLDACQRAAQTFWEKVQGVLDG